jgi:hypothetical protein
LYWGYILIGRIFALQASDVGSSPTISIDPFSLFGKTLLFHSKKRSSILLMGSGFIQVG